MIYKGLLLTAIPNATVQQQLIAEAVGLQARTQALKVLEPDPRSTAGAGCNSNLSAIG
jgi:isoaspartyl peptidase/L-asparaginase-like protein (Ntn-hydrolase superfamily)